MLCHTGPGASCFAPLRNPYRTNWQKKKEKRKKEKKGNRERKKIKGKRNNFLETIQFVRESSRHSQGNNARIRGRDSCQQKRYTENQRTLDEAFRQCHVFKHTHAYQKTITTLVGTIPRHRVPSIYHILSLARSPHSITRRTAMNQRPRWCGASLKAFRQFSFVRDEEAQAKREKGEWERAGTGQSGETRDKKSEQRAAWLQVRVYTVKCTARPRYYSLHHLQWNARRTLKPLTVAGAAISSLLNRR